MEWLTLATTAIGLITSVWAYVERRRAARARDLERENTALNDIITKKVRADEIDAEINSLPDAALRKRMRDQQNLRNGV